MSDARVESGIALAITEGSPAAFAGIGDGALLGRAGVGLVEIFTADEQRFRSSQAYVRSAVGERLRVVAVDETSNAEAERVVVTQLDERTGLRARSEFIRSRHTSAVRVLTSVTNTSESPVVLTAISSLTVGVGNDEELEGIVAWIADSTWLAESRWRSHRLSELLPPLDLALHGQDGRGRFGLTSHGAWPTGEHLPVGVVVDDSTGEAFAWQLESGAGWQVDLIQTRDGAVVSLLGPTDLEHQFAHTLAPGETFDAVPVAVAVSSQGRDGAIAELTAYRRGLRPRATASDGLPVIYNDFMNTLMGQPTTEALLPIIREAATAGVELFCIDAGWFADPAIGDWWATVGEWREATTRFDNGLTAVFDEIHALGMRSGIWLEPEIVGIHSPAVASLPDDAFFQRHGRRVVEAERYHLDFRHPAVVAHLDEVVDRLIADYGVSYFKLDYNINPGAGTEWRATGAGDGLLAHARAFRQWLIAVQRRHPGVLLENCSSGAMRADYHLLAVTHLQSTTDQQDFLRYPPIAASSPASIAPEQCGNWAYPAADMTPEQTAFTLVSGLSGRLYLSGFLDRLDDHQRSLVHEAIAVHKQLRTGLATATPFWPLGLPAWDDDVVCLGLHGTHDDLVFVWDRGAEAAEIVLPGVTGEARQVFPREGARWAVASLDAELRMRTIPGPTARVLAVTRREPATRGPRG